jgi:hypothetical protein
MAITLKARVIVWGRAAARCAFEGCGRHLVHDATELDSEALVGELAHIVGQSSAGPRGDDPLPTDKRDEPENLILLCTEHHTIVDNQAATYTADVLRGMKNAHEARVFSALDVPERARLRASEVVAGHVDGWADRARLDRWRFWTHHLLEPVPNLPRESHNELEELGRWLLSRIWPPGNERLQEALTNFRLVLQDLLLVFSRHSALQGDMYWTEKFYKMPEWNRERYDALTVEFDQHVELIGDLTLELTRAANWVCAEARVAFDSQYRLEEGSLLVDTGPHEDMTFVTHRVEYRPSDFSGRGRPYAGLLDFESVRSTRDLSLAAERPSEGDGSNDR